MAPAAIPWHVPLGGPCAPAACPDQSPDREGVSCRAPAVPAGGCSTCHGPVFGSVLSFGWRGQARLCGLDHDLGELARGGVVKGRLCGLDHDELGAGARMKERGQQVGHATQSMCMNGAIR